MKFIKEAIEWERKHLVAGLEKELFNAGRIETNIGPMLNKVFKTLSNLETLYQDGDLKTKRRGGKGCIILFSAGNSNIGTLDYPANQPTVIAVGASNLCDQRSNLVPTPSPGSCNYDTRLMGDPNLTGGSSYGTGLGVVALGINVATTDISGPSGYGDIIGQGWIMSGTDYVLNYDGTSASCPEAAAVTVLILSVNPNLTNKERRLKREAALA